MEYKQENRAKRPGAEDESVAEAEGLMRELTLKAKECVTMSDSSESPRKDLTRRDDVTRKLYQFSNEIPRKVSVSESDDDGDDSALIQQARDSLAALRRAPSLMARATESEWTWDYLVRRAEDEASGLNQSLIELARIISASESDYYGDRDLIQHNAESLTRILNEYPEHAERRDDQGYLPLSQAVVNRAPLAIIQLLAEAYPEGVIANHFHSDEYGNVHRISVLHDAVDSRLDTEHITRLLDTAMSHLCWTLRDGWECIHTFFADHIKLERVIDRLLADFPKLTENEGEISSEYYKDVGDKYALHYAVASEASIATIERVLHLWPDPLVTGGDYGRSPLHVLIEWEQSHDRDDDKDVRFHQLLQLLACPEALRLCDEDGIPPLHFYCSPADNDDEGISYDTLDLNAVKFLVERNPESVYASDNNGQTPVHLICERPNDGNIAVLNYLVQAYPQTLRAQDGNGHTPLQVLLSSEAAVRWRESFGQNPLHVLVQHGVTKVLLEALLKESPELVRETDNDGRLPLHIAIAFYDHWDPCGICNHDRWDERSETAGLEEVCLRWRQGVKCLLDAFPNGAYQVDDNGMTPLLLACERNLSIRLIYRIFRVNPISFFQSLGL